MAITCFIRYEVDPFQLDAFRGIDESREDDNRVELACPPADRLG